ncbi:Actin-depolymerizing factor 10 [Zea mays]|uniref:Actin-depolymerizing factor 10 n=1 Tax=Zea mays TaxID=4577 RepID=A0A1D6GE72_MAIZE|nr:Actin-depolymerizing factor 10 [Zea mays]
MLKFGELQSKRLHRFLTFKMDDKFKEIVVDQVGDRATSYEDFTNSLPENDCRYAIYDFDFVTAEDVQKSRIFYILWYCLVPILRQGEEQDALCKLKPKIQEWAQWHSGGTAGY